MRVRRAGRFVGEVDYEGAPDEGGAGDLLDGLAVRVKMRGGIDVGAHLFLISSFALPCAQQQISPKPTTISTAPASDHPAPAPSVSESGTVLQVQKTAKRFQLLPNPIEATDALWRAYANNRLAASSIRKRDKKAEAEGYESPESDDDDWFVRDDSIHVLRSIRRTMRGLEEQMLLPDGVLQKSVAVLNCEAAFEEADDVSTHTKKLLLR
ncbi:hypothetical protein GGX14DRAFT_677602 [Mycena pura]|uniref:Uncharacterized protein n=1 Tax=Mycena pura TaxID=153505 RepID=A0AAD6UU94_9AGAR|nr:hypothetical protein GGX14DRAFT_677602 [Mycena pura]